MTKDEYYYAVQENIKSMLPSEFMSYEINLRQMQASYGEYMGLSIGVFGKSIEPVFNLDHMYGLVSDLPMSEALHRTADVISNHYKTSPEYEDALQQHCLKVMTSFEDAKPFIYAGTCPRNNSRYLDLAPHRMMDDIALIPKIDITPENSEASMSVSIRNEVLERWGVTQDEVMDHAIENTQNIRPSTLIEMGKLFAGVFGPEGEEMLPPSDDIPALYVYSNNKNMDGFAGLFSQNAMKDIFEQFGRDFYILPSSVHEALIYPDFGDNPSEEATTLSNMVKEVNMTQVLPEDVVSDFAYHYDHTADKFEKAFDFAKRMEKEKQAERDVLPANITMTAQIGAVEKQII